MESALDNAAWHALRGPHARFAQQSSGSSSSPPLALRFDPEVAAFAAVEQLDPSAWEALAALAGVGGSFALFRDAVPKPPAGWAELARFVCVQMVAEVLADRLPLEWIDLGAADAPDMLALAEITEPGPFFPRTFELGRYIGLRRGGRLVAMAGERLRVPGHAEVSAVCTHPEVRGQGLGAAFTLEIAHGMQERGEVPFLHALESNVPALRLYEKLGFRIRRLVEVVALQWHADGKPWDAPREPSDGPSGYFRSRPGEPTHAIRGAERSSAS